MTLELHSLSRRFGDQLALDSVSLRVERGDLVGLLGHNGAGKTTLMRIALGLLGPAPGGRVQVDGRDARREPREVRARLGGLIEVPGFYGGLGGRANLALLGRLQGLGRRAAGVEADRLLELLELSYAARKPVRAWSQGMRQRLGVAQALLGRPDYLILDEPANGLDPEGIALLRRLLARLAREEGCGVLLSSHQLHDVADLCSRIAVLHRGRLQLEGETRDLLGGENGRYALATDDDEAAAGVLGELGLARVERNEAGLTVELGERGPEEVARAVIAAGRGLRLLAPRSPTLEELYLRATAPGAGARSPGEPPGRPAARPGAADATPEAAGAGPEHGTAAGGRRAPALPLLRVLRHELARWLGRPAVPLLLAAPGLLATLAVLRRAAQARADAAEVAAETTFSATDVTAFEAVGLALGAGLPLLALVLAGLASQSVAGELARGTLRNLLLRPVGRTPLVLGKAAACLAAGLLGYAVLAAAAAGTSAAYFDFTDVSEILPNGLRFPLVPAADLWPELRSVLLAPLLPLCAYALLGFLAGSVTRGGAGALALALGLVASLDLARGLARPAGAEGWLPSAYLPSPLGDSSALAYYSDVAVGISNASFEFSETAWTIPLVWALGPLLLAVLLFRRRSIP